MQQSEKKKVTNLLPVYPEEAHVDPVTEVYSFLSDLQRVACLFFNKDHFEKSGDFGSLNNKMEAFQNSTLKGC